MIQNSIDKEILPKRSRYYQSVSGYYSDTKGLSPFDTLTKLKKSYIIFICRHRPFEDKELHIFTFKNICKEDTTLELGDETVKIFLTPDGTAQDVSGEVKEFMAYMTDHKTESDFAKRLDDAVGKIRS